jgi:hypothetical protein
MNIGKSAFRGFVASVMPRTLILNEMEVSGMFDFLDMEGTHEQRKIANYKKDGVELDTCSVTDYPDKPYETGLLHPKYNRGNWIIVEAYKTEEKARAGHDKWVKLFESGKLPKEIKDCRL